MKQSSNQLVQEALSQLHKSAREFRDGACSIEVVQELSKKCDDLLRDIDLKTESEYEKAMAQLKELFKEMHKSPRLSDKQFERKLGKFRMLTALIDRYRQNYQAE